MNRRAILATGLLGVTLVVAPAGMPPRPLLAWNATASAPMGLYRVRAVGALRVGDLVLARVPAAHAGLFAERGYLPLGVPLLKHVAALAGDEICRIGPRITINGEFVALALERDWRGRLLPGWSGCRRLAGNAVFLLNAAVPSSLDGRYVGPQARADILGRAAPLWTRETPP